MATEARHPADLVIDAEGQAASEDRGGPAAASPAEGVYASLFREGYRFNFFQAVRLLEQRYGDAPGPGQTSDVRRERIFFRPHTGLAFPASDIRAVEAVEGAGMTPRQGGSPPSRE